MRLPLARSPAGRRDSRGARIGSLGTSVHAPLRVAVHAGGVSSVGDVPRQAAAALCPGAYYPLSSAYNPWKSARRALQVEGAAVQSAIQPGSLKFDKIEQNRSGDPALAQGFGRVSTTQPPKFTPDQHKEIVEFFHREGYAVIVGALSQEEVAHLNGFFSATQTDPHWRRAWGLGDVREGYHQNQGLIYSQPLLDHPELDKYTQHPSNYPVVCELMGGEDKPRFAEFNFREAPEGAGQRAMNFHHDATLPGRIKREPYGAPDWVCAIHCKQRAPLCSCPARPPRCVILRSEALLIAHLVACRPDGRE